MENHYYSNFGFEIWISICFLVFERVWVHKLRLFVENGLLTSNSIQTLPWRKSEMSRSQKCSDIRQWQGICVANFQYRKWFQVKIIHLFLFHRYCVWSLFDDSMSMNGMEFWRRNLIRFECTNWMCAIG